ncbi:hypothetical protein QWI17_09605 [Gilvimarinus sp. SDUM040013]|uniref:SnoaL-like domain-containing protein n=1 Tax=Gilvimarinus gilvus TaxID=3058038 RepID=A0ABU4S0D7_9GAMM|nr:hypothetical protein [Gilvimarinus sp. SDUM040013]MDO3386090.1 hypothetical protein [Gilvimarinus sp. SDUM040013]MDX6850369.1 hypothetical protein [Gilvimarinus sp. SDUM040013]
MTRLNRSADCGNSPKNKMVEDIGIALEMRDAEYVSSILDSEAVWSYTSSITNAAEKILATLNSLDKPVALTIDHVISHGKIGAVNGFSEHGRGEQRFCHIIEFTSTKCNRVKRIESYGG